MEAEEEAKEEVTPAVCTITPHSVLLRVMVQLCSISAWVELQAQGLYPTSNLLRMCCTPAVNNKRRAASGLRDALEWVVALARTLEERQNSLRFGVSRTFNTLMKKIKCIDLTRD